MFSKYFFVVLLLLMGNSALATGVRALESGDLRSRVISKVLKDATNLLGSPQCADSAIKSSLSVQAYHVDNSSRDSHEEILSLIYSPDNDSIVDLEMNGIMISPSQLQYFEGFSVFSSDLDGVSSKCKVEIVSFLASTFLTDSRSTSVYIYQNQEKSGIFVYKADIKESVVISSNK